MPCPSTRNKLNFSLHLYLATFWLRVRRYLCCQWFTAEQDTHDAFRKAGSGLSLDMNRSFALLIWMTEECNRGPQLFYTYIFIFNLYFSCASGAKNIIRMLIYLSNSIQKMKLVLGSFITHMGIFSVIYLNFDDFGLQLMT